MKTRFLVKCIKGYVNAEWKNGKSFPESFWFTDKPEKTFSMNRGYTLQALCDNNGLDCEMIEIK